MNISQFARSRAQIDPWGRSTEAVETTTPSMGDEIEH